jgi:hypothetical protein
MRTIALTLFLLFPIGLRAAWTFETISNASEGHMASRVMPLSQEKTLVAYKSGTALIAATSTGGALVPETLLPVTIPSNIYASVGTRGAGLISLWNAGAFWYALQLTPGAGNCGPSSNWQCGAVKMPDNTTGQLVDSIVGQADANLNAHFFYRLRTSNNVNNGVFYVKRSAAGVWTAPVKVTLASMTGKGPVAIEVTSDSSMGFLAAGSGGATYVSRFNGVFSDNNSLNTLPVTGLTSADMQKVLGPSQFCVTKDPGELRLVKRSTINGLWIGAPLITAPLETARPHCSIQVRSAGDPVVAYTSTADVVRLWRDGVWETVDASGVFSKPIIDLTPANKLLILYRGAGFLKFGREQ